MDPDNNSKSSIQDTKVSDSLQCVYCKSAFFSCTTLEDHVKLHTSQGVFVCLESECSDKFNTKSSLISHINNHFGVRRMRLHKNNKKPVYPKLTDLIKKKNNLSARLDKSERIMIISQIGEDQFKFIKNFINRS
jgi:uncharacterized Zn-finger protein